MSDKKWKSGLLSSSLPLEYEAAKTLTAKGFPVEADYLFGRENEAGIATDNSVDILARGFPPFKDPNRIDGTVSLLVECKYRVRDTKWLFFQDPNLAAHYSKIYRGCSIRVFDDFLGILLTSMI